MTRKPNAPSMAEFLRRVRSLSRRPVRTAGELANWQASADELLAWVRTPPGDVADAVPQFIWHYLSDADRRMRDRAYLKEQQQELATLLDTLSR